MSAGNRAKEQADYRLAIPFRQCLGNICPEQNLEEQKAYRVSWRRTSADIIRNLGRELVNQAGNAAIVGRYVKEKIKNKETEHHYSAPEAFNYFLNQIRKLDMGDEREVKR